ncbi:helix-turn-helix domain-containing protein, partial [Enterococcus sp. 5B3_DIV0040]|uniref:helix-turn-helix domain-containing protein n=1 Tax=Enterococcus sp. 5B3_DIV0040 TaxID=1834182 RepID=UPI000A335B49
NTIGLIEGFSQELLLNVFVNLKKKFFDESPFFRLLLYLLKYRKTRVVDISEKLMFSKSYSYKLISRLRDIFESQRIPITINSDFESISLEGNEKYIRTYHYLVQVMAYNVFADRQTRVNIDLVGENYKSLQTTKVKHEILLSILENAVSRGYLIQDIDKKSLEIFNINTWAYQNIYFENLNGTTSQYSNDNRIHEVQNIILNTVLNFELQVGDKELFANKLSHILSYFLPVQNKETVVIAISMLHHPEYVPVIQNKLLAIFNEKIIKFSSNHNEADILVSDGILNHDNSQDFAFFRDIHNKDHWDNLNSVVQARIISKLG